MLLILVGVVLGILLLGLVLAIFLKSRAEKRGAEVYQMKLSPAEEKAMMAFPHDGIADIYVGVMVIMFGLFLFTDMPWLAGVLVAVFFPLIQSSKRAHTAPRLSQIPPTPNRHGGFPVFIMITTILGVLMLSGGFFAFVFTANGRLPIWFIELVVENGSVLLGLGGALLWVLAGYFGGVIRYFAYGLLSILLAWIGPSLGFPMAVSVLALGSIVLVWGLVVFRKFLSRYPLVVQVSE